ncbi:unnamed protein product [Mytilus coruscus]|uniref:Integrase zinc-binding domain-containing protein n=1 Tax=Mytilus coruscus TaxID=42192 RepID=A0A6J8AT94_MYTCO|nr:unnamed protein product [Mytilus coruscus]
MQHQIKLSDDKPVAQPYRRIPPSQYEEVKAHIKDLLAKNIIKESISPYTTDVPTDLRVIAYQRTVESIENEVEEKHEQPDKDGIFKGYVIKKVTDPQQGETHQFVVPEALQKQVLEMLHEQAGHQEIERTTSLIRLRCYWTECSKISTITARHANVVMLQRCHVRAYQFQ